MTAPGRELDPAVPADHLGTWRVPSGAASPAMQAFGRLLARAAHHPVPVLLVGERGTGKTSFARFLHDLSRRAARPFVRVDCPVVTGDLSAQARAARRGTLFLDEVAELSPAVQTGALRLLPDSGRLPFRLVASTGHDLEAEMAAGRFRKDLYYRLDVLQIRIPPLRERAEDILPTARAYLAWLARTEGHPPPDLPPEIERTLLRYSWPGNVQELLGVLLRMLVLSSGNRLELATLPERLAEHP